MNGKQRMKKHMTNTTYERKTHYRNKTPQLNDKHDSEQIDARNNNE